MKLLKRFIYLVYYIRKTNYGKLAKFMKYASVQTGKTKGVLLIKAVHSVFKYNISLTDYFLFGFYNKNHEERKKWAGTGFMYEYQKVMNPLKYREELENKLQFNNKFKAYIKRKHASLKELKTNRALLQQLVNNPSGKMVFKNSLGQVGAQVEVLSSHAIPMESIVRFMEKNKYDLLEEFVVQHHDLMTMSASGLNTVRIFTQLNNGTIDFLGARLRITVNSSVDNMAAGNLAAPVNINTGTIDGPAVYSDITKTDQETHPITGKRIVGFKIPYWQEIKNMVQEASLLSSNNKTIGWDIAVRKDGPELIEGNHNWCKILWQLPVKKGLKHELVKYM